MTVVIAVVFGLLIGGRLGYVLFYSNGYYFTHPLEIFFGTNGGGISGMSFHGSLGEACWEGLSPAATCEFSSHGGRCLLCGRTAGALPGALRELRER
ncbi:MAG: prolipoprotein diacylglyceryl transferase family protein [Collinsella intestinalis]